MTFFKRTPTVPTPRHLSGKFDITVDGRIIQHGDLDLCHEALVNEFMGEASISRDKLVVGEIMGLTWNSHTFEVLITPA